jgi:thymidylate synthase
MEQVRENLRREPYPFPKLIIKPNIKPNIEGTDNATGKRKNIEDFRWEDIELIGYRSHPSIKADMAV